MHVCVHECACACMCVHVHVCVCTCMSVCIPLGVHSCICAHVCLCLYACMYVHVCDYSSSRKEEGYLELPRHWSLGNWFLCVLGLSVKLFSHCTHSLFSVLIRKPITGDVFLAILLLGSFSKISGEAMGQRKGRGFASGCVLPVLANATSSVAS